jgi:hypothetical protein
MAAGAIFIAIAFATKQPGVIEPFRLLIAIAAFVFPIALLNAQFSSAESAKRLQIADMRSVAERALNETAIRSCE